MRYEREWMVGLFILGAVVASPAEDALSLARTARNSAPVELQVDLVQRSRLLAAHNLMVARGGATRCSDTLLLKEYLRILEETSCSLIIREAAGAIRDLFSPAQLDSYSAALLRTLRKAQATDESAFASVLLLVCELPSTRSTDALSWARSMRLRDRIPSMASINRARDCVLARHGDKEAEKRVIEEVSGLTVCGSTQQYADMLAYVDGEHVRGLVALGLRSEDIINMTGGGTSLKRDLYANALVQLMRDEATFPVRAPRNGVSYQDDELDAMEQWCSVRLGLTFPKSARSRLTPQPRIAN